MNEKDGEVVIDIFELLGVFVKRIWLPIITTLSGALLSLIITLLFITPLYKSSVLLYVNNSDFSLGNVSISTADLSAAKSLVSTYAVILKSRTVINEVIELSGVDYTYDDMIEMVEADSVENTEVFSITVTSSNPQEAEMLANLYAKVLPEKITEIVNGSEPKVVDYAVVAAKRSSPSYTKNTAIGAVLGFALAAAIIIISYLRDDIIHSEEYITKTYPNIPLLTVVPDLINAKSDGYGYYKSSSKRSESHQAKNNSTSENFTVVNEQKDPFVVETKETMGGDNNG